jgi:hypothetical protein
MNSKNTRADGGQLYAGISVGPYVEAQGTAWIGNTEHKERDDDTRNPESHKLVGGARAQIVFQGIATIGVSYKCQEYDWYNDKWNNDMDHTGQLGETRANGKLVARAEFRWGPVVFQEGYQIWQGQKSNDGWKAWYDHSNKYYLDQLL